MKKREFNPSFPTVSYALEPACTKLARFWQSRRDCARLRARLMSWIISKRRAAVSLLYIEAETFVKSYVLSHGTNFFILKKSFCDLTDGPASTYDRPLSLALSLLKAGIRQFGTSGTDRLSHFELLYSLCSWKK